jgi:zinc-ribbon domain
MTYKRNFVCAIKVDGKVLRETGDQVELPFGSEYSILLKNLNSVRAEAQITIDGKVAGPWYILGPNASIEIERFNTSGNSDRGNRFKFIERTAAVEKGRGVQLEDGLVRVEFKREKVYEPPKVVEHHTYYHHDYWYWPKPYVVPVPSWPTYPPYESPIMWCGTSSQSSQGGLRGSDQALNNVSLASSSPVTGIPQANTWGTGLLQANMMKSADMNDAGITAPGSESDQKFVFVQGFQTEPGSEVVTLKLIGSHGKVRVAKAKTVDQKPRCSTCQKVNKPNAKFCTECGTSLVLL